MKPFIVYTEKNDDIKKGIIFANSRRSIHAENVIKVKELKNFNYPSSDDIISALNGVFDEYQLEFIAQAIDNATPYENEKE